MIETFIGMGIIVVSLIFGLLAIMFIFFWLRHDKLRIRDQCRKTAYIQDYWMTKKKDKETGIVYWKSVPWQPELSVEHPPDAALDTGPKGRMYAEAYKISEDEFVWITDKGIQQDGIMIKDGKKVIDTFKPFSVVQRDTLISQFKKAQEHNQKKWTPDKIIAAGAIMSFGIIIICLFIFWGDIAKPALDSHAMALETQKQTIEILQMQEQCRGELQTIAQNIKGEQQTTTIVQNTETPPPPEKTK